MRTTADIVAAAQGYKYLTLHCTSRIHVLATEEYCQYTPARAQPQNKELNYYTIIIFNVIIKGPWTKITIQFGC